MRAKIAEQKENLQEASLVYAEFQREEATLMRERDLQVSRTRLSSRDGVCVCGRAWRVRRAWRCRTS